MQTMNDFLAHFRAQRAATRKLVAAVPGEHFGWAPAPNAFTFGDVVRHMMQSEVFWRRMIVAAARGEAYDPFRVEGTSNERMAAVRHLNLQASKSDKFGTSVVECLDRWAEIQAKTEAEFAAIPASAFHAPVEHPLAAMRGLVWEACLGMLEHEIHHRGQLSAYLKMVEVEQPASLFE